MGNTHSNVHSLRAVHHAWVLPEPVPERSVVHILSHDAERLPESESNHVQQEWVIALGKDFNFSSVELRLLGWKSAAVELFDSGVPAVVFVTALPDNAE